MGSHFSLGFGSWWVAHAGMNGPAPIGLQAALLSGLSGLEKEVNVEVGSIGLLGWGFGLTLMKIHCIHV